MGYAEFFNSLTGNTPFPWQERVAEGPWPEALDVPTGMGKTAGVVVAWLHKRLQSDPDTGRRLVYCLPMRSLVRQVAEEAVSWCKLAQPFFAEREKPAPRVHLCMGGEADASWEEDPEREMILVGTQDLLLSRALCRGYGQSRYRWPVSFGLVSNDAFWIFDEPQLMGVGLETGVQLQAFRETLGTLGPCRSVFMSATLDSRRFQTVDHRAPISPETRIELTEYDRALPSIRLRIEARKPLRCMESVIMGPTPDQTFASTLASEVTRIHEQRGGLTLVVLNRVARAQAVFGALQEEGVAAEDLSLVHSRFRPVDRALREELLRADGDRVVVATQAVEAGLDISARTLITELAPFPSLVQRFGRLNRYGEQADAAAFWLDVELGEKAAGAALPYTVSELTEARSILEGLDDVGPDQLKSVAYAPPLPVRPVIRKRDLVDLFDTTPDLLGFGLDVSRYIRDSEDTDVSLFWRSFDG